MTLLWVTLAFESIEFFVWRKVGLPSQEGKGLLSGPGILSLRSTLIEIYCWIFGKSLRVVVNLFHTLWIGSSTLLLRISLILLIAYGLGGRNV
jgi:hypothetical protein